MSYLQARTRFVDYICNIGQFILLYYHLEGTEHVCPDVTKIGRFKAAKRDEALRRRDADTQERSGGPLGHPLSLGNVELLWIICG